jgi:hypothetical protein
VLYRGYMGARVMLHVTSLKPPSLTALHRTRKRRVLGSAITYLNLSLLTLHTSQSALVVWPPKALHSRRRRSVGPSLSQSPSRSLLRSRRCGRRRRRRPLVRHSLLVGSHQYVSDSSLRRDPPVHDLGYSPTMQCTAPVCTSSAGTRLNRLNQLQPHSAIGQQHTGHPFQCTRTPRSVNQLLKIAQ